MKSFSQVYLENEQNSKFFHLRKFQRDLDIVQELLINHLYQMIITEIKITNSFNSLLKFNWQKGNKSSCIICISMNCTKNQLSRLLSGSFRLNRFVVIRRSSGELPSSQLLHQLAFWCKNKEKGWIPLIIIWHDLQLEWSCFISLSMSLFRRLIHFSKPMSKNKRGTKISLSAVLSNPVNN